MKSVLTSLSMIAFLSSSAFAGDTFRCTEWRLIGESCKNGVPGWSSNSYFMHNEYKRICETSRGIPFEDFASVATSWTCKPANPPSSN